MLKLTIKAHFESDWLLIKAIFTRWTKPYMYTLSMLELTIKAHFESDWLLIKAVFTRWTKPDMYTFIYAQVNYQGVFRE